MTAIHGRNDRYISQYSANTDTRDNGIFINDEDVSASLIEDDGKGKDKVKDKHKDKPPSFLKKKVKTVTKLLHIVPHKDSKQKNTKRSNSEHQSM